MRDELTVTSLLQELRFDGIDDKVMSLCREAEQLRRQGRIEESIEQAKDAVRLARSTNTGFANGIAFLHLAVARHSSRVSTEYAQAIDDCDTAIAWLDPDDHNYFIAQALQARLFLDRGNWQRAVERYQRAIRTLNRLIEHHNRRGELEEADEHDKWRRTIQAYVRYLGIPEPLAKVPKEQPILRWSTSTSQAEFYSPTVSQNISPSTAQAEALPAPPQEKRTQPEAEAEPFDIFATGYLLELTTIPVYNAFAHAGSAEDAFELPTKDYLETNVFIIRDKPFILKPVETKTGSGQRIRLRRNQGYIIVEVKGDSMEPSISDGDFVLVRRQPQHDHTGQIIVVDSGEQKVQDSVRNVIKRIREDSEGIWLESINEKYPPFKLSDAESHFEFLGVVVGIFSPRLEED